MVNIAALTMEHCLRGVRGILWPPQVEKRFCQRACGDARVPYALRVPLEEEHQPAQQTSGTLTATQQCSDDSRCSPALFWSTCLAFDGKLAVRRDIAMSSALPASDAARRLDAEADHGCHCDHTEPGSVLTAMEQAGLGFGTIRDTAGAGQSCRVVP